MSKESGSDSSRWSLDGKTALVTNATETFGRKIVEELAQLGCNVCTTSRCAAPLNTLLRKWTSKGLKVIGSTCTPSFNDQINLMGRVSEAFDGKLNILVDTRMALAGPASRVTEQTLQKYTQILESCNHLSQLAYPLLKSSGDGNVVFISSVGGLATASGYFNGLIPEGLNQLAIKLALEWSKDNIRVNSVAHWVFNSPVMESFVTQNDFLDQIKSTTHLPDQFLEEIGSRIQPRRNGKSKQVSSMVAVLCSPAASYITGQVIAIDGVKSDIGGPPVEGFEKVLLEPSYNKSGSLIWK